MRASLEWMVSDRGGRYCGSRYVAGHAPSARAEVMVTINFDFVETRVPPRQEIYRSHFTSRVKLSPGKGVDFSSSSGIKAQAKLGESMTGVDESGQSATTTYQIIGGAVVITNHNPGFYSVLRITTDGRGTCSAAMKYFRNPGHQYFESVTMNGTESILASNFRGENMTCSIGE